MRPYYEANGVEVYHGDCRELLPTLPAGDLVIADPPYGETTLKWDKRVAGWIQLVNAPQLWCFGSLKFFMQTAFQDWTFAQDLVWEKHNGSGMHADRFRRVHEHVVHFYRGPWAGIYKQPVMVDGARARVVRRKEKPAHMGASAGQTYRSIDGGPRFMRSVLRVRSCHGRAVHPTQKPVELIRPLIEYSCPLGGLVIDPMAGSGTTGRAAIDCGRRAVLIEREERYCEAAAERLRQKALY